MPGTRFASICSCVFSRMYELLKHLLNDIGRQGNHFISNMFHQQDEHESTELTVDIHTT
jgi:hypothetical protein